MNWIEQLADFAGDKVVARAVIVAVHGPTPRSEGTSVLISGSRHEGRIGRPHAMRQVLSVARELIERRGTAGRQAERNPAPSGPAVWLRSRLDLQTGPVLGEASGGEVIVLIEVFGASEIAHLRALAAANAMLVRPFEEGVAPTGQPVSAAGAPAIAIAGGGCVVERIATPRRHFHVYGTGLAAQALVRLLAGLPFQVCWHDSAPPHFPGDVPPGVIVDERNDPIAAARDSEPGSFHAVMTSDHALDLAVCRAALGGRGFGYLGVIGSRLKRDRMLERLRGEGMPDALLARIACPMGLASIRSKSPPVMALSIAAEAMIALEAERQSSSG